MFDGGVDGTSGAGAAGGDGAGAGAADAITALARFDPMAADRTDLETAVTHCARVRAWIDSIEIGIARRTRQLADPPPDPGDAGEPAPRPTGRPGGHGDRGGESAATDLLGNHGRRDRNHARATARRSIICDRYPRWEHALHHGHITAAHLDLIARAFHTLTNTERSEFDTHADHLLDVAINETLHTFRTTLTHTLHLINPPDTPTERLERQRNQSTVKRWIDHITGMYHLHATLDPESGARIFTTLDTHHTNIRQRQETTGHPLGRLHAQTLTELITRHGDTDGHQPRADISIHIDLATLTHDQPGLAELDDGTPLPIDTIRRLCCNADIHPMFMRGTHCLAHGRTIRTATREQRRALRTMYRTCGIPHCTTPFNHCEIHHITPWTPTGPTNLNNLLPVCTLHHHHIHEGHWHLTMTPQRVVTFTSPDGHHTTTADTTNRTPPPTTPRKPPATRARSGRRQPAHDGGDPDGDSDGDP